MAVEMLMLHNERGYVIRDRMAYFRAVLTEPCPVLCEDYRQDGSCDHVWRKFDNLHDAQRFILKQPKETGDDAS